MKTTLYAGKLSLLIKTLSKRIKTKINAVRAVFDKQK